MEMSNPTTVDNFLAWVKAAKPNEKMIYYRGETLTFSLMTTQIKRETWDKALEGRVYLVQKKLGVGLYEFIAIRASDAPANKLIPIADSIGRADRHSPRLQTYTNRRINLMERVMS